MIRFFEDIAIQQSESLGVGVEFYHKEKVGWMLSRWRININRLPRFGEVIKIITNPKAFSGFYANREFVVLDKDACEIITANTLWIFVNLETRRPARISQIMYDKYAPSERDMKTFTKLEEIKTIEKVDYSKQFRVRLSDIDTNGHVNNSQYINWSMETYPVEIHSGHSIKKLTVNYLKETSRDDIVSAKTVIENSGEFICCASEITSGETVVARIESGWI
jgi:medium-chain acyl-[acyl-carrier-protein] hydrolase